MDYTKLPRSVVYKDRSNLSEYGVQTEGTLNHYLFNQMRRMTLLRCGNAEQIALQCLNNAYYICTLTQLEEFPDTRNDGYETQLMKVEVPFKEDVYQASMALACVMLAAYDDKYKQKDDLLIENIHHWTSHNRWMGTKFRKSFEDIIEACSPEGFSLPDDVFAPRDIIDVIENIDTELWDYYPQYICERLSLLDDSRRKTYGVDLAIARLNDELRSIFEDYGYDPKTNSFSEPTYGTYGDSPDFKDDFKRCCQPAKEAMAYINNNRQSIMDSVGESPKKDEQTQNPQASVSSVSVTEVSQLKNRISELSDNLKKKEEENKQLQQQLEELQAKLEEALALPEDITAEQRVRMEVALQLLESAGLTKETLGQHGNKQKAATIMSFLLGIKSNNKRGNEAQVCANYINDRRYFPRKQNMGTLIKLNTIFSDLRLSVCLKIGEQDQGEQA